MRHNQLYSVGFTSFIVVALLTLPVIAQAATVILTDCFPPPVDYITTINTEIPTESNQAGQIISNPDYHFVAAGPSMVANCACPKGMSTTSSGYVYELTAAGSPLPAGTNGYGYLTDHLDIDVIAYSDAINSPDGAGITPISIDSYPTPLASMKKVNESIKPTEATSDVCSDATRPSGGSNTKREFKWNVVMITLYVKQAILGEEIIPLTVIAQNYSCLSTGNFCTVTDTQQVSDFKLVGKFSAPLSCTINAGSTIEVELGNIVSSQFATPGEPPASYTLKDVNISYHCDDPAASNTGKIKLTLSADQGVVPGSNSLIAKMEGRDDIGVRVFDQHSDNVALDGSFDLPVTMDEQGNGSITMKAAPVSTTSKRPEPGKFEGNVTVKMDLR
ncbi:fimbrial protein [Citrobacter sp. Awk 4]|uniref:fimbrial protein n=1 Tax=Citrobacter sp. Awk 4 TaxID=2963955 RepID=UPI002303B604|nr:fimbrial protein [Citrobacter sp. Awk 4]MDA8481122.1 fimbrial protein [Citrobacter sp. Awk 4]